MKHNLVSNIVSFHVFHCSSFSPLFLSLFCLLVATISAGIIDYCKYIESAFRAVNSSHTLSKVMQKTSSVRKSVMQRLISAAQETSSLVKECDLTRWMSCLAIEEINEIVSKMILYHPFLVISSLNRVISCRPDIGLINLDLWKDSIFLADSVKQNRSNSVQEPINTEIIEHDWPFVNAFFLKSLLNDFWSFLRLSSTPFFQNEEEYSENIVCCVEFPFVQDAIRHLLQQNGAYISIARRILIHQLIFQLRSISMHTESLNRITSISGSISFIIEEIINMSQVAEFTGDVLFLSCLLCGGMSVLDPSFPNSIQSITINHQIKDVHNFTRHTMPQFAQSLLLKYACFYVLSSKDYPFVESIRTLLIEAAFLRIVSIFQKLSTDADVIEKDIAQGNVASCVLLCLNDHLDHSIHTELLILLLRYSLTCVLNTSKKKEEFSLVSLFKYKLLYKNLFYILL